MSPSSPQTHASPRRATLAVALNLVLPGGGLILLDATAIGVLFGAAFILLLNLALTAAFITPDDFARTGRLAAVAALVLIYAVAQAAMRSQLRRSSEARRAAALRQVLCEVEQLATNGDAAAALTRLELLATERPDDLLILHWRATLLTALGRTNEAQRTWAHLRRADRHGLFRDVIRANL